MIVSLHPQTPVAMTRAESAALRRATPRTPAATLNRDYGSIPSPGGQLYTPEQGEDIAAARDAERMAEALALYARNMRLAARWPESRRGFQAEGRAALHPYPELLAALVGEEARR